MIKDIKYSGYSAVPSDYECPDGELAAAINVLNEDGALHSLGSPKCILDLLDGETALLVHHVPGQDNWILLRGNRNGVFKLSWMQKSEDGPKDTLGAAEIVCPADVLNSFHDIAIVGNTLVIATNNGLQYLLWKDGSYKYLGNRPPFVPISFGARRAVLLNQRKTQSYSDVPRWSMQEYNGENTLNETRVFKTPDDDAFWKNVSDEALGLLLDNVAESITSKGLFYQPFYVRYAFRLFDGSYSWHSAPILMLCSTLRPQIGFHSSTEGTSSMTVTCSLNVPGFGLDYRIFGSLNALSDWSDIVRGIDVFISPPIFTYDQSKDIDPPIKAPKFFGSENRVLEGHYAIANDSYVDVFVDVSSQTDALYCSIATNENFANDLETEHRFYKIASLEFDNIKIMTDMQPLKLSNQNTTADYIVTLPQLDDEFNSHAIVVPTFLHAYNGRISMSGISMRPPTPFPLPAMAQAATKTSSAEDSLPEDASEVIRVYSRINGTKCFAEYRRPIPLQGADPGFYPLSEGFPRFLYHPDPNAYKMVITQLGNTYVLPLKQHPFLTGSYWCGGIGLSASNISHVDTPENVAEIVEVANKIYTSEVNNPFIFPPVNVVSIGCGRVMGLSSAAKALSQGQFGQFPLYAFTDEGIWALEISSTGAISARQPITRDVCLVDDDTNKPLGITQIDSAVLFPTDRGIMMISGSNAQCISDAINTEKPFDVFSLPQMKQLHASLLKNAALDTCLPTLPFKFFLKNCRMIYDYVHQRIIVYNPRVTYGYVYSLKSRLWGMMHTDITSNVPSYPNAMAIDNFDRLVDFSEPFVCLNTSLFVTRPLKLETPDILKTIDTVIQRGHFQKGHVQAVLYGSRDLYNWHLVWSSKDHYLRGFRGTPYKYFRIACVTSLSEDESIFGASIQFTPRLTDQPR